MNILKNYINILINSSLFKASGIYTIMAILNAAIPFFLLPILTRFLTPSDYGIISMFSLLVSITEVFLGLSTQGAILRAYYQKDEINFKQYTGNCIIILFGSTFFVSLLFFLAAKPVSSYFGVPEDWLWAIIIISFFQFIILGKLAIYRAQMKALEYSIISIVQTIINILLSIALVVFVRMNWQGRIIGQIVSTMIVGVYAFFLLNRYWVEWKINKRYIKHALSFGIPLIPHNLGIMFLVWSSRFFITNMIGLNETGIYTVGVQIGMIIGIITDSFNKAYSPWLYDRLNQNDKKIKIKIVKFTYIYMFALLIFALFLTLIMPFLMKIIVGNKFYNAISVISWLLFGYAFNGMYYMVTNYIFYSYKTKYLAWITITAGLISLIITYEMILINGIIGAAQAFMITMFLKFILTWLLSAKSYKMPWIWWKA